MITIDHDYKIPSDNLAQYSADEINRQEVTHEFMLDHINGAYGLFECCYFWRGDDAAEMGLDPWQIVDDFEYFHKPDTRVFVERKHLIKVLLDIRNGVDVVIDRCEQEGNDTHESKTYIAAFERFRELTNVRDTQRKIKSPLVGAFYQNLGGAS